MTKLDVLDDLDEIKIGIAYKYRGERLASFPGMCHHYSFDIFFNRVFDKRVRTTSRTRIKSYLSSLAHRDCQTFYSS